MKLVITGAAGLVGWHTSVHAHAANCLARFNGIDSPYELVTLNHDSFNQDATLLKAVADADAVLHFAGVNRGNADTIEQANPAIAKRLADACYQVNARPHIVYANTIHSNSNTPYGRSKQRASEILENVAVRYTNLILPHIFGECARPRYNNVTATFIEAAINGTTPTINPEGLVSLLHAGTAAQIALSAATNGITGDLRPESFDISVFNLFNKLSQFHTDYEANIYPDLSDTFILSLFNSYRSALYPSRFPHSLSLFTDDRGTLFEAVKGGGGGQSFLSTTKPGVTRGDHFHLNKVERFLVIQGDAIIRIRKVNSDVVWEYRVSGETPALVDIPTLHTHSIENVGTTQLLTLFWTHDLFDPKNPDTYAEKVLK